jgi:UDP-N-acetylmuramoyl-L-alanyl-D-glutamate--2,6-diaminopimelate ligase
MNIDPFKILPITLHSKRVGPGSIFVAIQGARDDGIHYIVEAVERGASEIILADYVTLDEAVMALIMQHNVTLTPVKDTRKALAERAAELYGYPARQLYCIGITGTKGKTTTAWLAYHILKESGCAVALLSTVENRIGGVKYPTELTTQQPDYLHAFLRICVDEGITHVVIEVAAQALTQFRVLGIPFASVAWLNFSQEHGEFYVSEQDYWNAKLKLFDYVVPGGTVIIPADDARFEVLPKRSDVRYCRWSKTSILSEIITESSTYVLCEYGGMSYQCPQLLGRHNSANLLVAIILAHTVGISSKIVQRSLENFKGIPGRLNWHVLPNGARACIDYAHNPASFEATLSSLRTCTAHLIVIFGAGGERDAARRPLMGFIAARYADLIFLTTDNPRSEDPYAICDNIMQGIDEQVRYKVIEELDREQAIRRAYRLSQAGTIIALLGKGPDEYQLVEGIKHPFSELSVLMSIVRLASASI